MIHRLTYSGGAQTVRTIALRDDGIAVAPASADYAVVDLRHDADDASHTIESGAATIDSVSTTTTAATGKGSTDPRQVTLTSAVGVAAGRRYLLTTGGRSEVVRVQGVSGSTVVLASPVVGVFPVSSTFSGLEMSATISANVCADEIYLDDPNRLAIRWSPAELRPWLEALYVERLAPAPLVSPDEVLRLDATLHTYASDDMTVAGALALAVEDFSVDMLSAGVDDDEILAGPIGRSAIKYGAAWHLLKGSTDPSAVSRAERYHARRQELISNLLQGWDKAKTARLTRDAAAQAPDMRSRFAVRW